MKIDQDVGRFKNIVRNKVKHNLGKYVSSDQLIGQQGNKRVSIPIDSIDLPHFTHSHGGGTGQGEGEDGDPIDGQGKPGQGKGKAGNDEGQHGYQAEFTADELAQLLSEELSLPNVDEKGKGKIASSKNKYTGIRTVGSEGLKHFKRTYKEMLKRNIASGTYEPGKPGMFPIKADRRYRAAIPIEEPNINTVVIYMMDVSGSMGAEQKHIVKSEVFWIDLWLKYQYKDIESRFIIHDTVASEVDREQFFTISESGGTSISSAYKFCATMMENEYPFAEYNVYPFHFSDGDNWGDSDDAVAVSLLESKIIPNSNLFCYGQVNSGTGNFLKVLESSFLGTSQKDKVILSEINNRNEILPSIKKFLGTGK
jgi:uncharacterized sporulation protein YeaH/YhbH (DUF444 family)